MAFVCRVRTVLAIGGLATAFGCGSVVNKEDAPPGGDAPPRPDAAPGSFQLAVTASGNGVARVTSSPPGIDCPGDCDEDYLADTIVTLSTTTDLEIGRASWREKERHRQ